MDLTQVILVDADDRPAGTMEKMEAHRQGLLHRAFSVFVFNDNGAMLLQQRALSKYHSGGLWTNACCSHPAPGEATSAAARRRLGEELGIDIPVQKIFDFVYRTEFENGLIEHEFDHVFTGHYNGEIDFNPEEVMNTCYKSVAEVKNELQAAPERYTSWFRIAFPKLEEWYRLYYNKGNL